jgi:hypothetical protein
MEYVLPFASMIKTAALPTLPAPPALPDYGTHKVRGKQAEALFLLGCHPDPCILQVSDFLNSFTRALSGYYGPAGVRILLATKEGADGAPPATDAASIAAMHARVHLCSTFRQARASRRCGCFCALC